MCLPARTSSAPARGCPRLPGSWIGVCRCWRRLWRRPSRSVKVSAIVGLLIAHASSWSRSATSLRWRKHPSSESYSYRTMTRLSVWRGAWSVNRRSPRSTWRTSSTCMTSCVDLLTNAGLRSGSSQVVTRSWPSRMTCVATFETVHAAVPEAALARVHVLALGGMSESGKSTVGEYLRTSHSHARLKIGYLIEEAASRCGIDHPYRAGAPVRAELLVDSLDRYCAAHHFLGAVSVESLHDYDSTRELRKLLGSQLSVLYVETSATVRAIRGTAGPADVTVRDAVKHDRGAPAVARIADEVIDNNGTRLELERWIDRFVLSSRWPTVAPTTAPVDELNLPAHLASYLSTLVNRLTGVSPVIDLLAVTGSGARGKYQQGWSDLDVFVIAEQSCIPHLRVILAELVGELGGVQLGLTIVTLAECQAGAVTSRLLYVLRLIGTGKVVPLWRKPDLALPVPDADTDVDASVRDGIQAAVELRRQLLRPAPDVRALYKVTALLAKVMLRFEGVECPSDDEALTVFLLRRHAEQHGELRRDARTSWTQTQRLAAFVLDIWLSTLGRSGDVA